MKVALLSGLGTDISPSMVGYASQLQTALGGLGTEHEFSPVQGQWQPPSGLQGFPRLSRFAQDLASHFLYPKQLRGGQADVSHILDHSYGHLINALHPERTVVTCHDLIPLEVPEMWRHGFSRQTGLRLYRRAVHGMARAVCIVADSIHTKDDVLKHLPVDPDRIRVVHLGIDTAFRPLPNAERPALRRKWWGSNEEGTILLHVGGTDLYKNIPGLLHILARVKERLPGPVRLAKVGAGFTTTQQRLIQELHLEENIQPLGRVSQEELIEIYNAAEVLVYPSLHEGFGWPPLEALACGLPVVAARVASIPEVVGEAGVLCPDPHDADTLAEGVCQILVDPALRTELVPKGLAQARKFTWEKCAREMLAVYEEVAGS